jgi:hypothetical protein
VRFVLDGAPVPEGAVSHDADSLLLTVDLAPSGTASLAWICPRFDAAGDPRRLGLPVAAIGLARDVG